ncbi:MAG: aminotransferase class I/II-fold pyridoxal phosphate-dependent enzyme [Bacilli bacterium]
MKLDDLVKNADTDLKCVFDKLDRDCYINSKRVLDSFIKNGVSEVHFNSTTGYGYNDIGRDVVEKVFADVLGGEDAIVRNQFISGTHALCVTLFGLLRSDDELLYITGTPYDTLHEVIGIKENASSLKSYNIKYNEIDLLDNDFDYDKIRDYLKNNKVKVVAIQRSKGYSTRRSINIDKVKRVVNLIKEVSSDSIIMVDNCYCEMVGTVTPLEVGADIIVGSLIKNLGGGIASNGAYVCGNSKLINLVSERLTVPGCGKEVGPTMGANKMFLQGLFLAPSVVRNSLKTAVFTSYLLEKLGYDVEPKYNDERADIVQNIIFNDRDMMIKYCQGIQKNSPIDSNSLCIPSYMPGYDDDVIMASGSFTQGSSIELSCDGPLRSPYIAYQQGSLTYEYGRYAIINSIKNMLDENKNE